MVEQTNFRPLEEELKMAQGCIKDLKNGTGLHYHLNS